MSQPDSLADHMELLADGLERVNRELVDDNGEPIYNLDAAWRASQLRKEATHRRAEEKEIAEEDALAQTLAREIFEAQRSKYLTRADLDNWDGAGQPREDATNIARKLIESGWRNG